MKYVLMLILGASLGAIVADFKPELVKPFYRIISQNSKEEIKAPVQINGNSGAFEIDETARDYYYPQRLNAAKYLALQQELFWKKRKQSDKSVTTDIKGFLHLDDFDLLMAACPLGYSSCRYLTDAIKLKALDNTLSQQEIFRMAYFGVHNMGWVIRGMGLEEQAVIRFKEHLGRDKSNLASLKLPLLLEHAIDPANLILGQLNGGKADILNELDLSKFGLTDEQVQRALKRGWDSKRSAIYNVIEPEQLLKLGYRPALDLMIWSFTQDIEKPVFSSHILKKNQEKNLSLLQKYAPALAQRENLISWYNNNYNKIQWDSENKQFY